MNINEIYLSSQFRRWGGLAFAVIVLMMASVYIGTAPSRLSSWFSKPFLGTFLEPGMTVASHGSLVSPEWQTAVGEIPNASQVVALNGLPTQNPAEVSRILSGMAPGDEISVSLLTPLGQMLEFQVPLGEYSPRDRLLYLTVPFLLSLLFLSCAIWVLVSGWKTPGAVNLAMCNASVAVGAAGFFDVYSTHQQLTLWCAAIAFGGGSLLHTALNYPDHIHLPGRWLWLRFLGYFSSAAVILVVVLRLSGVQTGADFLYTLHLATIYAVVCFFLAAAFLTIRRLSAISPYERDLSFLFLISSLISFLPVITWWVIDSILVHISFSTALLVPAVVFPLVSGYTIQHTRTLETDYRLMRVSTYALISIIGGTGYALIVSGIGLIWINFSPIHSNLVNGVILFLIALLVHPLRRAALTRIEPFLLHSERAFQDRIQTFSRELTRLDTLPQILEVFRMYIEDTLHPRTMQIFLLDLQEDHYASSNSDLVFTVSSPLVQILSRQQEPLFLNSLQSLPDELKPEHSRLALLGLNVFLSLPGREKLTGWVGLSSSRSGKTYSSRELSYVESLCDRVSLTIVRSMTSQELQQRVRELDALAVLSRSVSYALTLEDLAHNIYQQCLNVFHAHDFRLMVYAPFEGEFHDMYRVEDGQRLHTGHLDTGTVVTSSLEMDMLRSGQALLSDDYTRECLKRGVIATSHGVYSWMGVPLLIDDKVTGGLFLGSRDPVVAFTHQQLNLLQTFAGQVAGSIQKTNLLLETQKQTAQLAALNDLGHQIVSTLDLNVVLESTIQKAVSLMGGEAGSLLLLDEDTGELVFHNATGPVGSLLVGKRLPKDSGIAGLAIQSRDPVVINDVLKAPEWQPQVDRDTGFSTRALVAEPLLVRGRPIGVIEIINGEDGTPFAEDDLYLLASFAAQASLAIDNARLYSSLAEEYRLINLSKSEFISTIAHELKNPMTSIRGYSELLSSGIPGGINEQQAGFLATIQANVDRMSRLVTSLNDLSKLEAGCMVLEKSPVSLSECLQGALRPFAALLESRSVHLSLPTDLDSLPPVLADAGRLTQVLAALIHNAVVYSPPGVGITIQADCEKFESDQPEIHLAIMDAGLGVAPEDESHLFEKYFRSMNPLVRETPGIGLSLHLAKAIIEMQSGSLFYKRRVDGGSSFHITLPIQK